MSNSNLCFTNKKSNYNIRFINDKTIKDGSVYTIKGIKRDYYSYEFDKEEIDNLINFKQEGDNFILEKKWLLKNNTSQKLEGLKIVPLKFDTNNPYEIATSNYEEIHTVEPQAEFEAIVKIKLPKQPGFYRKDYNLYDSNGMIINNCPFYIIIRVIPDEICSPVKGNINVGDLINGMDTGKYIEKNIYYFCNWGVFYYTRTGNLKNQEIKPYVDTHKNNDRYAWDVNCKDDFDEGKEVYAISDGKVLHIDTKYGAIWILHDYVSKDLENEYFKSGYIAVYMHLDKSSWTNNSISKQFWLKDQTIRKGNLLGFIGKAGADFNHLHFAIYPLPFDKKISSFSDHDWLNYLTSVHCEIKPFP